MLENLFYRESSGWPALDQYVGELRHRHQGCLHRREHCRAPQRLRSWRCSTTKPVQSKTSRWPCDLRLVLFRETLGMGRWLQLVVMVDEMALATEMTHGAMTEQAQNLKQRTMRMTLWKGRPPRSSCIG